MTVLFYRYNNICEPDIISTFRELGMDVVEKTVSAAEKEASVTRRIELLSNTLRKIQPVFVFSINFFPILADLCSIYQTLYLCLTVDSPVLELFSKSIQHPTNRIFMFDRSQYDYFRPFNPDHIFHLPLAVNGKRFAGTIADISANDYAKYRHDISFVGSLYTEHNPFHTMPALPDYAAGYIDAIAESSLKIYGYNFMEESLTDDIIECIRTADHSLFSFSNTVKDAARYIAAHHYVGMQASETERIRTLNTLAERFNVHLYTGSGTACLHKVHTHGKINSLHEMPKVFFLSKINLNITIRPIQSGLPLRIFDILGCGGFLMTNYQPELSEHFIIGTDLEAYGSLEELTEKCEYYLSHEEKRRQIAKNGQQKALQNHSWQKRLTEMLRTVTSSL